MKWVYVKKAIEQGFPPILSQVPNSCPHSEIKVKHVMLISNISIIANMKQKTKSFNKDDVYMYVQHYGPYDYRSLLHIIDSCLATSQKWPNLPYLVQ